MVDVSERKFSKNMTFSEALELELKKPKKFTSHFVDPPPLLSCNALFGWPHIRWVCGKYYNWRIQLKTMWVVNLHSLHGVHLICEFCIPIPPIGILFLF